MKPLWSLPDQFFKIIVAESNGCYVFATYGLCVWGQPLFRRAFITCQIFSFSSQFTGRGPLRLRMSGLKSRAHLIRKYTYAESNGWYIFATYGLCVWKPLFRNAFLIRLLDFRHGIILEFAGPVFSRFLSHVQFLVSVPNLQAGAHGILDPPCATKLRSWMGYQGWSPWRNCSWSRCSFIIQAFWWLSGYHFVICMHNSRNRSPLRIFQYLPISATFVQCVDKDGLPELCM